MLVWRRFRYGVWVFIALASLIVVTTCVSSVRYWHLAQKHVMVMREQRLSGLTRYLQEFVEDTLVYPESLRSAEQVSLMRQQVSPVLERLTSANPGVMMGIYLSAVDQVILYAPLQQYGDHVEGAAEMARYRVTAELGDQFLRLPKQTGEVTTYIAPLVADGQSIGAVFADEPVDMLLLEEAEHLRTVWVNSTATILVGLLFSILLTASLSRNVVQLVNGIRQMAIDRNHRLRVSSGEFGEIARAINDLTRSLRDNQQLLQTLLKQLPMGVLVLDRGGVATYFNQTAADYTQLLAEDVIGNPILDHIPEALPMLDTVLVEGKELRDYVYRGKVKDYDAVALRMYGTPLRDQQGETIGAVCLFADITESDRLEQANEILLDQIRQAEKLALMGELAAGTAHEIRNPLMVIQGFVKMVYDRLEAESAEREWLQLSLDEVERIKEITTEFLVLAKPTAPQRIPTDIVRVIQETLQMVDSMAFSSGVKVRSTYPDQHPICSADSQQLKQVFLNLFTNAIQAMPGGGVLTVEVGAVGLDGRFAVKVHDTGVGISAADLPRIFDPFFSRRDQGTGLGLTVTARIVQNHEGTIEVKSEPEVGTIITVALPATQI